MLSFLAQGLLLGLSAGVSPGPLQTFFLSRAIQFGWKKTLPAAFAPLISDGPIVILVIGLLTRVPDWALRAIQILGGLFLLYLGWNTLQLLKPTRSDWGQVEGSVTQTMLQASLMNLLNPNPYIFWTTFLGPMMITAWRSDPLFGLGLGAGFYAAMISASIGLIILFSAAHKLGSEVRYWLMAFSSLVLFGFGIYQLLKGIAFLK